MPTDHVWVGILTHLSFCGMIFDLFSINLVFANNIVYLIYFYCASSGADL